MLRTSSLRRAIATLSVLVGAGVALKIFWHRIRRIFGGDPVDLDDDPDDDLDA